MRYRKAVNLKQRIRGRPREKPTNNPLNLSLKRHTKSLFTLPKNRRKGNTILWVRDSLTKF